MKSLPKISFVVPVFNTEKFLSYCINSILADDGIEAEIIVVNDASTGNCDEVIQGFQKIKYLKFQQNSSQFQARLEGLKLATGDYVCFVDSDDYFLNPNFGRMSHELEESHSDFLIFNVLTGDPKAPSVFEDTKKTLRGDAIFEALCNSELRWNLCDKLFRTAQVKEVVRQLQTDHVYMNMCDDFCLLACIAFGAQKVSRSTTRTTYFYRVNEESETRNTKITNKKAIKHLQSYRCARNLALQYLVLNGATTRKIQKIDSLHFWNMTWYFENYIRRKCQQEKFELYPYLLESFNLNFAVDYLLHNDFDDFCSFVRHNKQYYHSPRAVHSIAIFVSSLGGGGTERVAVNLGNMLDKQGFKVIFITSGKSRIEYGVNKNIKRFEVSGIGGLRFERIFEICNQENIDTTIFVDYYIEQTFYDIVWARLHKFSVIAMEHNMFFVPIYTQTITYFKKRLAAYTIADALTCLSEMDLFAWKASGVPHSFFIPNEAKGTSKTSVSTIGLSSTKKIIFVGRLCEAKGIHFLPDLISKIKSTIPDVQLDILGSFASLDEENQFKREIKIKQVENEVNLVGQVLNVDDYFSRSSVHIMLSRFEGYPMVLLEAKSCGVPSVIFDMPYLVGATEEDGCLQVPYADLDAMASKIIQLLSNRSYWEKLSKNAKSSLIYSSTEVVLAKWIELFNFISRGCEVKSLESNSEHCAKLFMHEFYKAVNFLNVQNYTPAISSPFIDKALSFANSVLPLHSRRRKLFKYLLQKCLNRVS